MSCRTAISGWSIPAICLVCLLLQSTPAAAQATSGQITAIPVYVYSSEGPFYFYTTDSSEGMALEASSKGKWSYQGILGYVAPRQLPGTIPLYKLIKKYDNSPRPKRQYTRSPKQLELLTHIGWKLEGSILYISATQVPGTFPIYRAEFPETGQRLDTTGHFSLGPEGYLWSKPVPLDVIHTENQHTPDLKDQLFSQGCSKIQGKPGDIECPTEIGLQLCESARKQGQMKITACHTRLNQAAFAKVQSDLFSRGCSSFLGRAGEYLCQTSNGDQACRAYLKRGDGMVTNCVSAKQAAMERDLTQRGCSRLAGRSDQFLCSTDDGLKTCQNYRIDGQLKSCQKAGKGTS